MSFISSNYRPSIGFIRLFLTAELRHCTAQRGLVKPMPFDFLAPRHEKEVAVADFQVLSPPHDVLKGITKCLSKGLNRLSIASS